jgi:hypothetical protein
MLILFVNHETLIESNPLITGVTALFTIFAVIITAVTFAIHVSRQYQDRKRQPKSLAKKM